MEGDKVSRPNKPRDVYAEKNVVRRIGIEREARGWSLEGLARRMTDAGCAINQSAIYKMEKGDPPRALRVDELVVLSRVFELSVEDLLTPPELAASKSALAAVKRWLVDSHKRQQSEEAEQRALDRLRAVLNGHPAALLAVEGWVAENIADPSSPKGKAIYLEFLARVTGVDPAAEEWKAQLTDQLRAARRATGKD
jgi:transcriptional regulator with XRE-family HTH domain